MQVLPFASNVENNFTCINSLPAGHFESPMMTVGGRLRELLDSKKVTPYVLAKNTGIAQSTISRILSDQTAPNTSTIAAISKYLEVDASEISGNESKKRRAEIQKVGYVSEATPLYLVDETEVTKTASGSEFRDIDNGMVLMTIPLVDEFAYASYPHGWKDAEYIEDLPKHSIVLPRRDKGRYRAFVVRGESMDDNSKKAICPGDIAIGRNVEQHLWDSKLYVNGGRDYIIVHHEGIIIKRIVQHDVKTGIIQCVSTNPDKETYPDFTINLSEVYELYLIYKVERDWRH